MSKKGTTFAVGMAIILVACSQTAKPPPVPNEFSLIATSKHKVFHCLGEPSQQGHSKHNHPYLRYTSEDCHMTLYLRHNYVSNVQFRNLKGQTIHAQQCHIPNAQCLVEPA